MMKILAITRASWDNSNNVGNTLSNIFSGFNNTKFYNLYLRNDIPKESICNDFYQITENQILLSILSKVTCGRVIRKEITDEKNNLEEVEQQMNSLVHQLPFYFPWFVREFIWGIGNWKNEELKRFLYDASPDIIFMPVFPCWYTCKVLEFVHSVLPNAKIVLFHADDDYSYKHINFSPLFWLYRYIQRKWIRKITAIASLNYCISEQQVEEYSRSLNCECKLLQKGVDITKIPENSVQNPRDIIEFVYTGNLICGRWKTLAKLGDVIRKVNKEKIVARLSIYSASLLTNKMKKSFNFDESVVWKGRIPASEVYAVQKEADILVHAESLNYIEALEVRLSFSTKIVDYLAMNKCIMALGCAGIASIEYFKKYDNAIVATNEEEIKNRMDDILKDKNILSVYAEKSRKSAIKLNDDRIIKEIFAEDIKNLSSMKD